MYDDASFTQMALRPGSGDERLYVEFKYHPMLDDSASEKAGRPIYRDTEFVRILIPGDKDTYFQPATPQDIQRFRRQYEDFKAGKETSMTGTPLALLPGISESMVEEFKHFKVRTIEQLASLNDSVATQFVGIHEWKRKAQAFIRAADQNAPLVKVQAELEQRDSEINALRAQLKELAEQVAATMPAKGKTK